ncbi:MAG: hypothetical protein CFE21_02875 [Bacteroidetes bacterium B1(2017)]|nr:MAG: hypothetical protein CFE21_02875 [Bacteroidetes bacterium B1(2017)]
MNTKPFFTTFAAVKNKFLLILLLAIGALTWQSCRKNDVFTKSPVTLSFSTDTVFFDTIFSKLGSNPNSPRSITLQVRVTNPTKNAVKTNISLAGNFYGLFKLNVDGKAGTNFTDVEIRGNDSIYIFVQAYIDPVGSNTPFIVTDQILFETNGTKQDVDLVAWTQDAIYFQNEVLDCSAGNLLWTSDKPIVIYDSILVPKGCTLTIEAGTQIHSYNKSCILIAGTLIVNGTTDKPAVFQGSRLDDDYKEMAGQWIGIRFLPGSSGNSISGAIIKNGFIGIEIDSMPSAGTYGLILKESIIKNMSAAGLLNYSAKLYAENNLVYNCGLYSFIGELGGTYDLFHNTFSAQSQVTGRKDPGFYLSNAPGRNNAGTILYSFPLKINVRNNIIYGSLEEEFLINDDPDGVPIASPILSNCLIKTKDLSLNTNGNILNLDPKFKSVSNSDFDLETNSPCRNAGANVGIPRDLKGRNRNTSNPSIGAYEVQ